MLAVFQCLLTDYCKKKKPKNCTHAINIVCVIYLVFFDWSTFEKRAVVQHKIRILIINMYEVLCMLDRDKRSTDT